MLLKKKKPYTRIRSQAQRNEIMKLVGTYSFQELSDKYKVSPASLYRWYGEYKKDKNCPAWRPARSSRDVIYYRQGCTIKYILEIEKPKRFPIRKIQPLMPPNTDRTTIHRLVKDVKDKGQLFASYWRDMLPLDTPFTKHPIQYPLALVNYEKALLVVSSK